MDKNEISEDLFGNNPYQTLVTGISDFAIIYLDIGGRILSWNAGAEQIFGFTAEEVAGRHFSLIFTPEDKSAGVPEKEINTARETGRAEDTRWHRRKDGSLVYINGVTSALKNKDGAPAGYAKIGRDYTGRRRMETALEISNQRNSNILESISDAFFALDKDWRFAYLNKQSEPLLRRSREELAGKSIWEEFPEAVGTVFYEMYHKAVAGRVTVTFEEFYPPLETWFEVRAYPSNEGLSIYFHNINERIERRRLENLNADIGKTLVRNADLRDLLKHCAEILVERLNAAFARIWTLNEEENTLELQASAGMYTHLDGKHSRVPVGKFKIGLIAEERLPRMTNDILNDPRLGDKEWARREGMKSFAGYPLIVEKRLVGVMCVFARQSLSEAALEAMASISNGIAGVIERKRIENALRRSEEQYRVVAEAASDAIISISAESVILFANSAATKIFGYETGELVGQSLTILMPEYLRALHRAGHERYLKTGIKHLDWEHTEVSGLRRDGSEFPLELSFGEYRQGDERIFIGIARDITERKRAEEERETILQSERQARQAAEQASKIKDEFLATVSHELRTPLNAILGWSTLLRSGKVQGESLYRALETVERNARAQSQLIEDLLDISRIITGKLRLEIRPIELSAVIEAAVEAVRPAAEAKNIRLQTLLDPQAGPVSGDADRLQQIFWNLLSNAVKFTPKGKRVVVRLERIDSHVEVTVSDTGCGIEPEFLPFIFDRFRQADQTTTRRHGGLGLGLSIVRQLTEMHGGAIEAQSEGAGRGASFIVKLPRLAAIPRIGDQKGETERVHPTASEKFVSIDCAPELTGLRILVVDDEPDARELLREVLEMCGSQVTTAGDAAAALAALEREAFDVLISDIGMLEEDGYRLIEKARALPKEKSGRIPAIALTAYARVEDRVRALTAGFQAHVPKPVEPVELAAVVASLAKGLGKTDD